MVAKSEILTTNEKAAGTAVLFIARLDRVPAAAPYGAYRELGAVETLQLSRKRLLLPSSHFAPPHGFG